MTPPPDANPAPDRAPAHRPDPDPRPQPPEPPLPGDCCDSGCDPCVHDSYSEQLQYYREQLAAWLTRHPEVDPGAADPPSSTSGAAPG